jgi:flagellar protein FliS
MQSVEQRYMGDSVATAGAGKLVVMVYDRLVADFAQAETALEVNDIEGVHRALCHATEVIRYLRATLRLEVWEHAPKLAALYDFLHRETLLADTYKDRARIDQCADIARQLASAWHLAAERYALEDAAAGPGAMVPPALAVHGAA